MGVSAEFYARIERGKALPSVPTLARISSALGVSADLMLGQAKTSRGNDVPKPRWATKPPNDNPEVRRVVRRVRQSSAATLRLVGLLIKELERNK
jgi:transcriptional regulator with XRE-family HTH domain